MTKGCSTLMIRSVTVGVAAIAALTACNDGSIDSAPASSARPSTVASVPADNLNPAGSPLLGTNWTLESLISPEMRTEPIALDRRPTLLLDDNDGGTADGFAGCNLYGAPAVVSGQTVTFGPLVTTEMMCEGEASDVERAVVPVLHGDVTATISNDRLLLMGADGYGLNLRAE